MIKIDQAADESGVYTLKSLTSWNYWDKLAALKDTETTFGFIYFISSKKNSEFHFTERIMLVKTPT